MNDTKKLTIISASPKVNEASVSDWLSGRAKTLISDDNIAIRRINVRKSMSSGLTEDYEAILSSDALLIIFPLYIFCLPGILIRYLQDYNTFWSSHRDASKTSTVFCAVNCGFPEAGINEEAVRVIKSFSKKIGAEFRFGLMIGGGGMLLGTQQAPFMKRTLSVIDEAFNQMKNDILTGSCREAPNYEAKANFPRRLYFLMGNLGWHSQAKKNGLKRRQLYARPYM